MSYSGASPTKRNGYGPSPSSGNGSRPYAPSPNKSGNPTTPNRVGGPTTPNRIGVRTLKTPPTSAGLTLLSSGTDGLTSPDTPPPGYGKDWSNAPINESVDETMVTGSRSPTPSTTPVPVQSDKIIRPSDIADTPPPKGVLHKIHHKKDPLSSPEYSEDDFESSSDEADTPVKNTITTAGAGGAIAGNSSMNQENSNHEKSPSPPPGEPTGYTGTNSGRRGSRRGSQSQEGGIITNANGAISGGGPPPTRAHIQEPDGAPQEKPKKPPALQVNMGQKTLIGRGSFGDVYKALDTLTNNFVAVKEIVLVEDDTKDLKKQIHAVEREMRVMQKLDHPNIVKYLGAKRKGSTLYLYTEFIPGGTISDLVRQYGPCNELQAAKFMKQILLGLDYLHSKQMVHRDLKGENLFIDSVGGLKLGDFGTSKELKTLKQTNSVAGTPYFMAPEVINCSGHGLAADIWSVGCCLIQLLTGKPPFHECDNAFAIMFQVSKGEIESQIPKTVSEGAQDFIQNCVRMLPKERWTTQQLLAHPWLITTLNEPRPKSATTTPQGGQRKVSATVQKGADEVTSPPGTAATPAKSQASNDASTRSSGSVTSPDRPTSAVERLRQRVASATPPPDTTTTATPVSAGGSTTKPPRSTANISAGGVRKSPPPPDVNTYQGRGGNSAGGTKPASSKSGTRPVAAGTSTGTPLKRTPSQGARTPGGVAKRPTGPK